MDISKKDWRDGDIVFAKSTCYDDGLEGKIGVLAIGTKKGAFFVSFTKCSPSTDMVVMEHSMERTSWGEATVYIQQKTTDGEG